MLTADIRAAFEAERAACAGGGWRESHRRCLRRLPTAGRTQASPQHRNDGRAALSCRSATCHRGVRAVRAGHSCRQHGGDGGLRARAGRAAHGDTACHRLRPGAGGRIAGCGRALRRPTADQRLSHRRGSFSGDEPWRAITRPPPMCATPRWEPRPCCVSRGLTATRVIPDALLPPELRNANPLGIQRLVDGKLTRDAI